MPKPTWIEGIGPPLEQLIEDYEEEDHRTRGGSREVADFLALARAYRQLQQCLVDTRDAAKLFDKHSKSEREYLFTKEIIENIDQALSGERRT